MAAVIVGFAAAAFAVIVYCGYRDKVSDTDAQEMARTCLIETCENIYLGRCGHE